MGISNSVRGRLLMGAATGVLFFASAPAMATRSCSARIWANLTKPEYPTFTRELTTPGGAPQRPAVLFPAQGRHRDMWRGRA